MNQRPNKRPDCIYKQTKPIKSKMITKKACKNCLDSNRTWFYMLWPTCKWHSNANSFAINDDGKSEKNVFCKTLNILSS